MSNIKVISQYIKDLSFETPNSPEIFLNNAGKPDIELSIDIDAKKVANNIYEIILKIKANAKASKPIFICEVAYAGLFSIENIENDMLEQVLLVYCPNIIFPFARKIIANVVADSGLPPLMIDPIDFSSLYLKRKKIAESEPVSDAKN